jgi:hypothetical protein
MTNELPLLMDNVRLETPQDVSSAWWSASEFGQVTAYLNRLYRYWLNDHVGAVT